MVRRGGTGCLLTTGVRGAGYVGLTPIPRQRYQILAFINTHDSLLVMEATCRRARIAGVHNV